MKPNHYEISAEEQYADAGVADDSAAAFHWFTHVSSDSIEIYNTSLL